MNEFLQIFQQHITRPGSDKLLEFLKGSDFFTAPASARFHLAEAGGLVQHSVNVYHRLLRIIRQEYGDSYQSVVSDESIAICGLLHDVCKVNFYVTDHRNVKENGVWVSKPYYSVSEKFPYGHGEKSVYIVNQYIKLTAEEALAINWHMGAFDDRVKGGSYTLGDAFEKYKLVLLLHIADMQATYLDESRSK